MGNTANNNWPTPVATDLVKDGWEAIKDLGDAIDTGIGQIVDWTDFTPTWTAGAGAAIGNGSLVSRYAKIGKTVFVRFRFVFGSTTNFGAAANWSWSLPVTANIADGTIGTVHMFDSSANAVNQGNAILLTSTTFWINITATGAFAVSNATPWTWAASDNITIQAVYEAA
jgi:hypothetical protein